MDERRFIVAALRRSLVFAVVVFCDADLIEVWRQPSHRDRPVCPTVASLARDYGAHVFVGEPSSMRGMMDPGLDTLPWSLDQAKRVLLGRERATQLELCRDVLARDPRLKRFIGTRNSLLEDDTWRTVPLLAVALGLSAQLAAGDNPHQL